MATPFRFYTAKKIIVTSSNFIFTAVVIDIEPNITLISTIYALSFGKLSLLLECIWLSSYGYFNRADCNTFFSSLKWAYMLWICSHVKISLAIVNSCVC